MSTVVVTISAGENGKVSPCGKIKVPKGQDVDIAATPDDGYRVLDWYCFGRMGHTETVFRVPGVSRDTSVHVEFERIAWSVRTTPQRDAESPEGRIEPQSSTSGALSAADGETLVFAAHPATGHFLQRWLVDGDLANTGGDTFALGPVRGDRHVKAVFSPQPSVRPFAAMPSAEPLTLRPDETLARALRAATKGRTSTHLSIADATDLASCPDDRVPVLEYASASRGSGDKALACDSVAKVGVMVALFRLRAQLRALAVEVEAREKRQLLRVAEHYWKREVSRAFPRYGEDFPDLDGLFDGPPQRIGFSRTAEQNLSVMIANSGNRAAGDLMKSLGFQYLHGALRAEGLCDGPGTGIWIPMRYQDLVRWKRAPIATGGHAASPRALTRLFAAIARRKLIDAEASREMRALLERACGQSSWCGFGSAQEKWSKIGLLFVENDGARHSEAGFFRVPTRSLPGAAASNGSIAFVLVAIGFMSWDELKEVAHAAASAVANMRAA